MLMKDVMVTKVAACSPEANLAEVAAIFWESRCGSLPVLDEHGHVISMITDRDIAIALGTRNVRASEVKVKDVAPARVFTCAPNDDFEAALNTMVTQNVRRLPVVEDGKLVGVVSIEDLAWNPSQCEGVGENQQDHVIMALGKILSARARGHVRQPAQIVATRA
jgi:CBS domain-containing protein